MLRKEAMTYFLRASTLALLFTLGACGVNRALTPTSLQQSTQSLAAIPASGARIVLSSTGGFSGVVNMPAPTSGAGAMVHVVAQTTQPSTVPVLQSAARRLASGANTPLLYLSFTLDSHVDFPSDLSFTLNLPQAPAAGATYFLGTFDLDVTSWRLAVIGPGTVSGSIVTFATPQTPMSWDANEPYWYVLYQANS